MNTELPSKEASSSVITDLETEAQETLKACLVKRLATGHLGSGHTAFSFHSPSSQDPPCVKLCEEQGVTPAGCWLP